VTASVILFVLFQPNVNTLLSTGGKVGAQKLTGEVSHVFNYFETHLHDAGAATSQVY
jgi:hypothetical protein